MNEIFDRLRKKSTQTFQIRIYLQKSEVRVPCKIQKSKFMCKIVLKIKTKSTGQN